MLGVLCVSLCEDDREEALQRRGLLLSIDFGGKFLELCKLSPGFSLLSYI